MTNGNGSRELFVKQSITVRKAPHEHQLGFHALEEKASKVHRRRSQIYEKAHKRRTRSQQISPKKFTMGVHVRHISPRKSSLIYERKRSVSERIPTPTSAFHHRDEEPKKAFSWAEVNENGSSKLFETEAAKSPLKQSRPVGHTAEDKPSKVHRRRSQIYERTQKRRTRSHDQKLGVNFHKHKKNASVSGGIGNPFCFMCQ